MEKSYRLCNKCEKILKATLNHQHAWLFGNRLKNLKTKALKVITSNKDIINTNKFSFLRYLLSTINILILCYLLNVKVELPSIKNTKQFIPNYLTPYTVIVKDYYYLMRNSSKNFAEEIINFNQINFETNFLGVTSTVGFLLHVFLVLGENFSNWWKVNEMLVWILLFLTSSIPLNNAYSGQVKALQVRILYVQEY